MARRTMRKALAAAAVAAGSLVGLGSGVDPAGAHTTAYCGHDSDGIMMKTVYQYAYPEHGYHYHVYKHYELSWLTGLYTYRHTAITRCVHQ
jgi:hypothetical protein